MTQVQLAQVLDVRQATVSQMEKRSDLLISALRSYVEAMDGKLNLVVAFPDRPPVFLECLGDTEFQVKTEISGVKLRSSSGHFRERIDARNTLPSLHVAFMGGLSMDLMQSEMRPQVFPVCQRLLDVRTAWAAHRRFLTARQTASLFNSQPQMPRQV